MSYRPSGILVPQITPFTADDRVATDALEALTADILERGAAGIVAFGTTGEPSALDEAERREVLATCERVCADHHAPLIVGAGTNNTIETVRSIDRLAGQATIAAALVVVPYYVRPSEAGVVAHFRYVADRSPVPVILYNVPYRTGRPLGADAIAELADHPSIVGIKQAVGSLDTDTLRLLGRRDDAFAVLTGEDTLAAPMFALGAPGAILATANVYPGEFTDLLHSWSRGRVADARALGDRLTPAAASLMSAPNPTVIKAVLHAMGRIPTPAVRLPLLPTEVPADLPITIAG